MTMNLRTDDTFVQDEGWYQARRRYQDFLRQHRGQRMVFLELGVGSNTPAIIKYPFWRRTLNEPHAFYACVNCQDAFAPRELADRCALVEGDIGEVLKALTAS